jgi:hypothetical protein
MNELCLQLLLVAAQFAEYSPPDRCPKIEFVPAADIRRYVCPDRACPTWGLYIYGRQRLLIEENLNLDDIQARGIVVHELVHFLQERAGEIRDRSCEATLLRERVAFWTQEQYLRQNGLDARLEHNMAYYSCDQPPG